MATISEFARVKLTVDFETHSEKTHHGRLTETVYKKDKASWLFDITVDDDFILTLSGPVVKYVGAISKVYAAQFEKGQRGSGVWIVDDKFEAIDVEKLNIDLLTDIVIDSYNRLVDKGSDDDDNDNDDRRGQFTSVYAIKQMRTNRQFASFPAIVKDFNKKQKHVRLAATLFAFDANAYTLKILNKAKAASEMTAKQEKEEEGEELFESGSELSWGLQELEQQGEYVIAHEKQSEEEEARFRIVSNPELSNQFTKLTI